MRLALPSAAGRHRTPGHPGAFSCTGAGNPPCIPHLSGHPLEPVPGNRRFVHGVSNGPEPGFTIPEAEDGRQVLRLPPGQDCVQPGPPGQETGGECGILQEPGFSRSPGASSRRPVPAGHRQRSRSLPWDSSGAVGRRSWSSPCGRRSHSCRRTGGHPPQRGVGPPPLWQVRSLVPVREFQDFIMGNHGGHPTTIHGGDPMKISEGAGARVIRHCP